MERKWRILIAWLFVLGWCMISSNFSQLLTYGKPKESLKHSDSSGTIRTPENFKSINQSSEWEQKQQRRKKTLSTFCSRTNKPQKMLKKQVLKDRILMNHLLVDDNHRVIYCYIPKIGCSNWKRVLLHLREVNETVSPDETPHMRVHDMTSRMRLYQKDSKDDDVMKKMETYTKFIVVRNPIERLISAYFDKIHRESATPDFQRQVLPFVKKLRENAHLKDITLEEFLSFVSTPSGKNNEHWISYETLCRPCQVDYDFILKLETIEEDAEKLLKVIGAPANLTYPHTEKRVTTTLAEKYMNNFTTGIINGVVKDFSQDFVMFGYNLPL